MTGRILTMSPDSTFLIEEMLDLFEGEMYSDIATALIDTLAFTTCVDLPPGSNYKEIRNELFRILDKRMRHYWSVEDAGLN